MAAYTFLFQPEDAIAQAVRDARDRVRADAIRCAYPTELLGAVADHVGTYPVPLDEVLPLVQGTGARTEDLQSYLEGHLLQLVLDAFHRSGQRWSVGLLAAVVGVQGYQTFCKLHNRCTGRTPEPYRRSAKLDARCDPFTWCQLIRGELPRETAQTLYRHLLPDGPTVEPRPVAAELAPALPPFRFQGTADEVDAIRAAAMAAPCALLLERHQGVRQQFVKVLRYVGQHFWTGEDLDTESIRAATGIADTAVSAKLRFYVGEPLQKIVQRLAVETALGLLAHRLSAVQAAQAVGLTDETFRRAFKRHTGRKPSDLIADLRRSAGHPSFGLWLRVGGMARDDRPLTLDERRRLAGHVLAACPQAAKPAAVFVLSADDVPKVRLRAETRVLPRLLDQAPAPPVPVPSTRRRAADATVTPIDWQRLETWGRALSTDQRDAEGRYATEFLLAESPESAADLYDLREVQSAATVAHRMAQGEPPPSEEPLVDWLLHRARRDRNDGPHCKRWRTAEGALLRCQDALALALKADAKRVELLRLPPRRRKDEALRLVNKPRTGDPHPYLVAALCLFDERRQRGRADNAHQLAQLRLAVTLSTALCKLHIGGGRRSTRRASSVLTDLLAVASGRVANHHRVYGNLRHEALPAIQRALDVAKKSELGRYARAEVANLHASVLKDEGLHLEEAERRAREAVEAFEEFDGHLAGRVRVNEADVQWLLERPDYMENLEEATGLLDERRDPDAVAAARNNQLRYLVADGEIDEAARRGPIFPWPTVPVLRAKRTGIEGVLALKQGKHQEADRLLTEAIDQHEKYGRPNDLALLYLDRSANRLRQKDQHGLRSDLERAASIAETAGLPATAAIRQLVSNLDAKDLFERITDLSNKIHGRLRPFGPRRGRINR